ncbi:hypothetical protein B0T21DRAFT_406872 [Apiosordaria backusii]|uniref:Chromo domain-containing protein n=1 Tax=Apiosordaria backusii TaxID=314023 RepID=A0AA40EZF2_9PEZI|nr:hypothetical protein B0T21DRAFT_406872 [Apiosordaria backusii]
MAKDNPPPHRKTMIEIPLPSIRKYTPGSGPPPPKISLLPPDDSTGYIIDQFVLPTDEDMTPTSRRMIHYHIGFTDLPAAKLLVPCHKVLDYISPRELENWEYRNAERLEEEKKAQQLALKEQQMAKKKKAPAAAIAEGKQPVGRPPKIQPTESHSPSPTSPANETLSLVQQVAGPSLATPKKRKLSMALENEEDTRDTASDQDSDEVALQRQLHPDFADDEAEQLHDAGEESQWVGNSEAESVDQLGPPPFELSGAETSRASSLAPSRRGVLPPLSQRVIPQRKETPVYPPKLKQTSLPPKTKQAAVSLSKPKETPIPPPKPGQTFSLTTKTKQTPVVVAQSSQVPAPGSIHPAFAAAVRASTEQKAVIQNGAAKPKTPKPGPPQSHEGTQQSKSFTPIPRPEPVRISQWTPAAVGRGSLSQSAEAPSSRSVSKDRAQEKESKKKEKKKESRPRKQQKVPPPQEEVYDVKDLLDDRWINENGVKVHKYLVLWVGDWPEGQNPTWEPDENIQDKGLIRRYHEKKASGTVKPPPKKMQKTLHHYMVSKQYSSVAEAFEDGLEVADAGHHHANDDDDMDMDKEEFLVAAVDNLHPQYARSLSQNSKKGKGEGGDAKPNGKVVAAATSKSELPFSAFDASLAQYQQSLRGAPR